MKRDKILLFAFIVAVLVSCGQKGNKDFGDNEFPVETVKSQSTSMQTSYPTSLKGIQDVEIRPKVAGFITQVCVKEGQTVSAGQLLFVIDNATYQAAVRQAQASVNTATAQCNTVKMAYENSMKLRENKVIGDFELQSAKNNYESAKAQLAQAQAGLASAKEMLGFCYVKSPTAGVVGTLPYKEGAMVSASSMPALTTVSNISTIEAYFSMTEKDILEMTKNAGSMQAAIDQYPELKLQLSDGSIYSEAGRLVKASGVVDAATGSVQMIARFPNPQRLLKSGASGSIVVPRSDNNAIVIPQSVTVEVQDKVFVYLLGKNNKVKYTEIKVDTQNDGKNYIVLSGLKAGDKYVTNGITKLTDGMEIKPITTAQYQKKIEEATKLGENQNSAKGFINAMSK
ncbi:MAG: efflux RND transporter periplasmic adaptor subunit [Porphyromonadaceae bacterium]